MPREYLDLVMDALRQGRLRLGYSGDGGDGVLSAVVEDGEGGEARLIPVARLVACPPGSLPWGTDVAEG